MKFHSTLARYLAARFVRRTAIAFGIGPLALAPLPGAAQSLRALGPLESGLVTYFISDGAAESRYRSADQDLAAWALAAWEREAKGMLHFAAADEKDALVRVYWVEPGGGQYGEMLPLDVDGRRGAAVFIRPDTDALGPAIAELARNDPLFRDTIVYLTCLHELGHALGLEHTANYVDVMYFFGFGGDIPRFFGRYRDQLAERADIMSVSGLSAGDILQLMALYPKPGEGRGTLEVLVPGAPPRWRAASSPLSVAATR
jgi:hypothetical protein